MRGQRRAEQEGERGEIVGDVTLRVGSWEQPLNRPEVVEAFFGTLTYRLEPKGKGTRFPVLVRQLFASRLAPASVPAALAELAQATDELRQLPADKAVVSHLDLRRFPDHGQPVDQGAKNLADLFIARDGRPILAILEGALREGERSRRPVLLDLPQVRRRTRQAVVGILLGLAMAAISYLFPIKLKRLPDPFIPLWPLGLLVAAIGIWDLSVVRSPAVANFDRANPRVKWILFLLGVAGVVAIWAHLER